MADMTGEEIARIQAYFQKKFNNPGFTMMLRDKNKDSAEVMLNGEFIGVVYKDDEEKEVSYDFNMGILEVDLLSEKV